MRTQRKGRNQKGYYLKKLNIYIVSWIYYSKLNSTPRETYELEKIINKKLFKPYSPEYKKLYQI